MTSSNLAWMLAASLTLLSTGCGSAKTAATIPAGTTTFTVAPNSGSSAYTINGIDNPSLTLQRGQTYTFNVSAAGHPFYIMSVQGTNPGNAYASGVTGNGTTSGALTFVVPAGAPGTLYYDCSVHAAMTGTITVTN